jgi:hypothetical protein
MIIKISTAPDQTFALLQPLNGLLLSALDVHVALQLATGGTDVSGSLGETGHDLIRRGSVVFKSPVF